jgi:hypothetical protein
MAPATHPSAARGILDTACLSILAKRLVRLVYRGGERTVEPYLLFATRAGDLVLHGWQVAGAWETTPPPHWSNLTLADVSSIVPLDRTYTEPHAGYNPDSPRFYRIICQVPR